MVITMTAMIMQSHTSNEVSVRIRVEPKRVLHTSELILEEVGNRFMSI